MSVQCFDCAHFSGREPSGNLLDVARVGLGRCPHKPGAGRYVCGDYPRECENFSECEDGAKRRAWVSAQSRINPQQRRAA